MTFRMIDRCLARWMRANGHALLRFGLGLVFVWFGAPKLVPGLSPADALVRATVPWADPTWFVPLLGVVEMWIGLCLWNRRWLRFGLVLMAGHMVGAALPLVTLPEIAWKSFPVATLEGQYILKNLVLIAGAIVLGGASSPEEPDVDAAELPRGQHEALTTVMDRTLIVREDRSACCSPQKPSPRVSNEPSAVS